VILLFILKNVVCYVVHAYTVHLDPPKYCITSIHCVLDGETRILKGIMPKIIYIYVVMSHLQYMLLALKFAVC
jgi:hypothetical protein